MKLSDPVSWQNPYDSKEYSLLATHPVPTRPHFKTNVEHLTNHGPWNPITPHAFLVLVAKDKLANVRRRFYQAIIHVKP